MNRHRTAGFAGGVSLTLLVGCASVELQSRVNTTAHPCTSPRNAIHVPVTVDEISGLVVGGYKSGRPDRPWITPQERPLSRARVIVRELGATSPLQEVATRPDGRFELDPLSDGLYQLEVCYPGFDSAFVPIRVQQGFDTKPLNVGLELSR